MKNELRVREEEISRLRALNADRKEAIHAIGLFCARESVSVWRIL